MDEVTFGKHIVQYSKEYSLCAGCNSCEAICSLVHDGVVSPSHNRLFLKRGGTLDATSAILTCQHCSDHPCYEACPKKDAAMCVDGEGIVYVVEDECIGCRKCIEACRFDPPRINLAKHNQRKRWAVKKCDLCRTRPEGPACVQYCPVRCLGVDTATGKDIRDPEVTERVTLGQIAGGDVL